MRIGPGQLGVLVVLLAAAGGGLWAWSDIRMRDRLVAVRTEAAAMNAPRGFRMPSDAEARAEIERIAAAHDVVLEGLTVHGHDEDGVSAAAAHIPGARGRMRVYDIHANATASELVFSRSEPIDVTASMRISVELAPAGARPGVTTSTPSIDVFGGLSAEERGATGARGLGDGR
jgi:hypothetical protein